MLPKNCGQLLYNAVRETLETMAFAEVIPCSIKVGNEEFAQDDDFAIGPVTAGAVTTGTVGVSGWGDESSVSTDLDSWGTVVPPTPENDQTAESWGTVSETPEPLAESLADDSWDEPEFSEPENQDNEDDGEDSWGKSGIIHPNTDPWGDANSVASQTTKPKEADFDNLVADQSDWCWACMKVNSPDIHSVWFIVSKGLANALAQNMYAGEEFQLDNPLIRDLIAELTNVLGGRLMLLLEELGGKFTLTVPEIGFGLPNVPEQGYETAICKIVVDGEHPIIVALCFNQGGILSPEN